MNLCKWLHSFFDVRSSSLFTMPNSKQATGRSAEITGSEPFPDWAARSHTIRVVNCIWELLRACARSRASELTPLLLDMLQPLHAYLNFKWNARSGWNKDAVLEQGCSCGNSNDTWCRVCRACRDALTKPALKYDLRGTDQYWSESNRPFVTYPSTEVQMPSL